MKRTIIALFILALLLAGCGGDSASPTTTTTTTHTTTTTAELSQDNNKALCVGLLNIGSCNTVQVNTQNANRPAGSPAPQPNGPTAAQTVGTLVLLCVAFVFIMGFASVVMGRMGL